MQDLTPSHMSEEEAQKITEEIRYNAKSYAEYRDRLMSAVETAKAGNAHLALGYKSWTAYLSDVLGEKPMRLARGERQDMVRMLSAEGMSTRAIAPIVGASLDTVSRDRHSGVRNRTPAADLDTTGIPPLKLGEVTPEKIAQFRENQDQAPGIRWDTRTPAQDHEDNTKVTGLDGKAYTRPEPATPAARKRAPLVDTFRAAAFELTRATQRITRLMEDDRLPKHKEDIEITSYHDLIRARDAITAALAALTPPTL